MARLTLVNALALSVGCIVAYLSMAQLHGLATRLSVEAELQDSARTFANTAPLGMSRADFGVRPDFIQGIAADGKVLLRSANLGNQQLPLAPQSLQRALASNGFFDTLTLDGHRLRAYVAPVQVSGGGDPSSRIVLVQVASPIEEDPHARLPLPWLAASAICGVLGTMLVGWLLARSAMAPVEQLATTVRAINSTEDLALRVPLQRFRTHGALRRLAEDVNNMLARLQAAAHELRVALEGQRRFVADASHELRTPLTSLRGNVQLLTHLVAENAGKAPPAERLEILRDMTHETERMSRLVDGLLLLARADAQQHLILTPTELAPLLQQAYRASRVLAEDVYVQLDRVAEGIWVLADPDRLQQVVLILLENAVKYTPAGGRVCLCSARVDLGGKPGVTIEVRDSGLGVAPVDRDLIFERFYRSESARKHAEGAGLGLAVARWIAREHGGDISLRDAEPTGSIFTVWLPTTDATDRPGI